MRRAQLDARLAPAAAGARGARNKRPALPALPSPSLAFSHLLSRRLLQWTSWTATLRGGAKRALAHAEYYERTLYNAVLGTQRGTNPGQMLYMFPLGSGVSKAGIAAAPQVMCMACSSVRPLHVGTCASS